MSADTQKPAAQFTVDDAIVLAASCHHGQRDKGRPQLPYITHPMRVMAHFDEPVLQMIAVLHDAVEDTELTLERLREAGAPERVIRALDAITHGDEESDETYWARLRLNRDALQVKLVDVADNSDPERLALLEPTVAARLADKYARARTALRGMPEIPPRLRAIAEAAGGTIQAFPSRRSDERAMVVSETANDNISSTVTIAMDASGAFRWRVVDAGPLVSRMWGDSITEYEYVYTVPAENVAQLSAQLGGQPDEDLLALVKRCCDAGIDVEQIVKRPTLAAEFSNWHS